MGCCPAARTKPHHHVAGCYPRDPNSTHAVHEGTNKLTQYTLHNPEALPSVSRRLRQRIEHDTVKKKTPRACVGVDVMWHLVGAAQADLGLFAHEAVSVVRLAVRDAHPVLRVAGGRLLHRLCMADAFSGASDLLSYLSLQILPHLSDMCREESGIVNFAGISGLVNSAIALEDKAHSQLNLFVEPVVTALLRNYREGGSRGGQTRCTVSRDGLGLFVFPPIGEMDMGPETRGSVAVWAPVDPGNAVGRMLQCLGVLSLYATPISFRKYIQSLVDIFNALGGWDVPMFVQDCIRVVASTTSSDTAYIACQVLLSEISAAANRNNLWMVVRCLQQASAFAQLGGTRGLSVAEPLLLRIVATPSVPSLQYSLISAAAAVAARSDLESCFDMMSTILDALHGVDDLQKILHGLTAFREISRNGSTQSDGRVEGKQVPPEVVDGLLQYASSSSPQVRVVVQEGAANLLRGREMSSLVSPDDRVKITDTVMKVLLSDVGPATTVAASNTLASLVLLSSSWRGALLPLRATLQVFSSASSLPPPAASGVRCCLAAVLRFALDTLPTGKTAVVDELRELIGREALPDLGAIPSASEWDTSQKDFSLPFSHVVSLLCAVSGEGDGFREKLLTPLERTTPSLPKTRSRLLSAPSIRRRDTSTSRPFSASSSGRECHAPPPSEESAAFAHFAAKGRVDLAKVSHDTTLASALWPRQQQDYCILAKKYDARIFDLDDTLEFSTASAATIATPPETPTPFTLPAPRRNSSPIPQPIPLDALSAECVLLLPFPSVG